jgi:hypothetical protein
LELEVKGTVLLTLLLSWAVADQSLVTTIKCIG